MSRHPKVHGRFFVGVASSQDYRRSANRDSLRFK
jgi:hypothetical protein